MKPVLELKKTITCLVTVAILAFQPIARGAEEKSLPWKITADRITHQQDPQEVTAEGKVILQQYKDDAPTGLEVKADRIQYNVDENSVNARGDLHLRDKYDEVKASEAQINLTQQVGFFKDATIFWQDTKLTASAELIEKTDVKSYHFVDGKITTCPPEKDKAPDWSVWGRDVEITLDDYAKLRHATFRIKDVPVFYLPYARIPIRNIKKSGLLFPEYSSSDRNGFGIIAPVFLNLSPSYDMTLYPGYYEERGPLLAGEFRYIASFNSRGTFMVNYLDDELVDSPENDYKNDGKLRTGTERYWIRGKADHDFGNRLVAKLDIDLVSDRDYLQEFKKGIIGFDQGNSDFLELYHRGFQTETIDLRENSLQLSKVWRTTDLLGEINIIDDLRDEPEKVMPAWALPRIAYSGLLPFLHTPVDLTWGTEYVHYWRDEGVGGHRIDLFPQLNGPISLSPILESSYLVGLRETLYFIETHDDLSEEIWGDTDFENRTLYNIILTGATTLSRDYDLNSKKYKTFRHAVRPELSYILVNGSDQEDLPFLDNEDRILEKNWLQYGFNNYFRAIRHDAIVPFRRNFSSFKINQVYDIDADDKPFSDLYFELILRGFENLYLRYETSVSVYGEGFTTHSLVTNYINRRGDSLNIDYRYKKHHDIEPPFFYSDAAGDEQHEIRGNIESRLTQFFSVKFDATYSLANDSTVDSTFSLIYHNPCWTLEFAATRSIGDNSFFLLFSLAGISTPLKLGLPEF